MSGLWNQQGVPQRGWTCVSVFDLRGDDTSDQEVEFATCEMCGNERIRFVHVIAHREYESRLQVGCVCAEKMSEDYRGPRLREKWLRNKASRKAKWLSRRWRVSSKGNPFLNVDGHNLVVFANKFKQGMWSYGIDGHFSREAFATQEEAKLALFEEFLELACDTPS